MKFIISNTYEDMSRIAADIIAEQLTVKPDNLLGFATGTTPIGLYDCLGCSQGSLNDSEASRSPCASPILQLPTGRTGASFARIRPSRG